MKTTVLTIVEIICAPENVIPNNTISLGTAVGNASAKASAKPIAYMATATVWPKKNTIPMAPPNSKPRLRLIKK